MIELEEALLPPAVASVNQNALQPSYKGPYISLLDNSTEN